MKSLLLAERLYELFVGRDDVYGVETASGWRTERGRLTLEHVERHLKGEFTLGVYPFTRRGLVKWILADLDYKGGSLIYKAFCEKYGDKSVLLVDTGGRGTHVFAALYPTPLWLVAPELESMEKKLGVKMFPKQRTWQSGAIGNFARLPLGLHHKTGRWSQIVRGDIWSVKPFKICSRLVIDNYGYANCVKESVGLCEQNLCPKKR
jgi:hypothetical protein